MAVQGRPILGIDINPNEVCVVEMYGAWPDGHVVRADAAPTPRGALVEGRVAQPEVLAEVIRSLMERMGVGTREAIVGMMARNVVTRVVEVPRVPDNELPMVIEGELAHYQLLGGQTTTLDYFRLPEPEDSRAIPQVLVVAAEENTIRDYYLVADLAGLRLLALEPSLSAMYRSAYLQLQSKPAGASLSIGSTEAEIVIVDRGQIRLYRRIDIGSDNLILQRKTSGFDSYRGRPLAEVGETTDGDGQQLSSEIDPYSAENLAVELQRSIEYYQGQNPQANPVNAVVIAIDNVT